MSVVAVVLDLRVGRTIAEERYEFVPGPAATDMRPGRPLTLVPLKA